MADLRARVLWSRLIWHLNVLQGQFCFCITKVREVKVKMFIQLATVQDPYTFVMPPGRSLNATDGFSHWYNTVSRKWPLLAVLGADPSPTSVLSSVRRVCMSNPGSSQLVAQGDSFAGCTTFWKAVRVNQDVVGRGGLLLACAMVGMFQ